MTRRLVLVLVILLLSSFALAVQTTDGSTELPNSWVTKAPMPTARDSLGVAVVDNKIYAIGGDTWSGVTGVNEEYDPSTNYWTLKASMPLPKDNFAIAAYQNKIYCVGGSDGVTEVYDTTTNTWKTEVSMPTDRTRLQANVVAGKIYCIGGETNGDYSNVNEVYDPATNSWSSKAPIPSPTGLYSSAVFDGKIYVIGGFNGYAGVDLTQIYNPENDSWTLGTPPPVGEISSGVVTSGINASVRIYCFSGRTQIYDPYNDSWSIGTPIPENIGGTAATVNDKIYVIGGVTFTYTSGAISGKTEFSINQQYTPVGYGTPDPTYALEHFPPQISFQSPLNQTYNDSSVPITFTVNKKITYASYSLDGQQNVTITGNSTIPNVPNGFHNLTIYANDTYGNVGSQTVNFTVETPQRGFFGSLTIAVIAVPVALVCLIIGLLLYTRHRKTTNLKQ